MREKTFLGNRGIALMMVMVFTFILLIIGATFLRLATLERISADKSTHLSQSFYLAEAGLERGENWLNLTSSPPASAVNPFGDDPQSLGDGTYMVTITPLSTTQYEISSTGSFGHPVVAKTLRSIMQVQSIFSYAVFGDESVTMRANSRTDSYNSQNGLYGGANVMANGDIATNAITTAPNYAISIRDNAWVNGDAFVGPGGDIYSAISVADTSLITGTPSVLPALQDLPQITAPTGLTSKGVVDLDGNLTINSSGQYSSINLRNNSILTLDGENIVLYITGSLRLNNNSQLVITSGSHITVYLAGDFYQESNTAVNNVTKDPTNLTVYGVDTADDVIWYSNSEFYGALYARNANILINSNAQIYGSIIGNKITLDSNTQIHYDEALATSEWGPGSSYRVISWEEEGAVY